MSFHPLTIGSSVFNQTGPGIYTNATCVVGGPLDVVKLSGGKITPQNTTNASMTRSYESDVSVGGVVKRIKTQVILQIQLGIGHDVSNVDNMATDIDAWLTPANLNRLLLGDQ